MHVALTQSVSGSRLSPGSLSPPAEKSDLFFKDSTSSLDLESPDSTLSLVLPYNTKMYKLDYNKTTQLDENSKWLLYNTHAFRDGQLILQIGCPICK